MQRNINSAFSEINWSVKLRFDNQTIIEIMAGCTIYGLIFVKSICKKNVFRRQKYRTIVIGDEFDSIAKV